MKDTTDKERKIQERLTKSVTFNAWVAAEVGDRQAYILDNIRFWCEFNSNKEKPEERNLRDGRYWTFDSISDMKSRFPWLTERQIGTAINKLEDNGYILSCDKYNEKKYDKTKWYSLSDKGHNLVFRHPKSTEVHGEVLCKGVSDENVLASDKFVKAFNKNVKSIQQKCQTYTNIDSIDTTIDSNIIDSNSLNIYNKIINHYNSVLSLKSLNWTKCQSASKNKTVSERLSKELDEFGYDFIIAAIDKLSETKYGVSIAGQGKYPKVTLFFILTKLEKINSDGYAELDKPTSDTPLDKQIHPDVQMLFDLYNSSVEGRAAHSATSISPKLHQDILNAIELYGMEELKRFIPVVCQNDYFNGENQNNDDGRVWLGIIGYFFREDKIGLIMEDKQYGDPNKFKAPKPKLPKGQKVSDSRFERGLRYFVETGSWDDFSFGPEPKRGLDKRLSKLTDAQYEKYLIAKKQKG